MQGRASPGLSCAKSDNNRGGPTRLLHDRESPWGPPHPHLSRAAPQRPPWPGGSAGHRRGRLGPAAVTAASLAGGAASNLAASADPRRHHVTRGPAPPGSRVTWSIVVPPRPSHAFRMREPARRLSRRRRPRGPSADSIEESVRGMGWCLGPAFGIPWL